MKASGITIMACVAILILVANSCSETKPKNIFFACAVTLKQSSDSAPTIFFPAQTRMRFGKRIPLMFISPTGDRKFSSIEY